MSPLETLSAGPVGRPGRVGQFQNTGHTIIFEGKDCIEAPDDSGQVSVQIYKVIKDLSSLTGLSSIGARRSEPYNHSVVQEISASGRIQHANGKLKILGNYEIHHASV